MLQRGLQINGTKDEERKGREEPVWDYFIYLFIYLYTCNDFSLSRFGIQMSAQVIEEIIVFFKFNFDILLCKIFYIIY